MRFVETHIDLKVDMRGIDNNEISSIPLVNAGGLISTITGEVIVIMYQHACHGQNKIMHSSPHVYHYNNTVDEHTIKVGGEQHVTTVDK